MSGGATQLARYREWLARERGLVFADYASMWRWSVDDLAGFWSSIWSYFDVRSPTPWREVLDREVMPGAHWFAGARLNYAKQIFRHAAAAHAAGHPAIVYASEEQPAPRELGWPEFERQVQAFAARLRECGVVPGDRVAAWLPNAPAATIAFLACASAGAIWSVCSPDMGPVAVLDRFRQIEPKVLVAVDRQRWGGVTHDRRDVLAQLLAGLPTVGDVVLVDVESRGAFASPGRRVHALEDWIAGDPAGGAPVDLPFEHPIWIVYSSGTTGLPKPIVHGHGGIVLEGLKGTLLNDIAPSVGSGERFHWFSSTGWIVWNGQINGLLNGTTICLFDGNPGGPVPASGQPADWGTLWRFAQAARVTWFGAGAAFYASCLKAGIEPQRVADLSRLRAIGATGSPLSEECHDWIWNKLPAVDGAPIWIDSISGGTDFAGAFVGGNRELPQVRGEMQCRWLGAAVAAFDESGREVIDEVGELVCTKPMPSMPLFFWNDEGGKRYHDSYFDVFKGIWRHGDWLRITPRGTAVIYGRSDATINRHGIRMGTSELYRAVEGLPEVLDSLVVDLEYLGRESYMPLFVVLRQGVALDAALDARLRAAIKAALSARHVPNQIFQVAAIPRTLSGKKMELPVKKLLLGAAPEQVMKRDAMANAESIDWFVAFARERQSKTGG
jgi:acetoacetyl-CoA synthetase